MDSQNVLISVILPVYNGELYIEEAIESILNQTFKNFEFIIIDDGSSDRSLEIIKHYKKQNNKIVVISRENKGLIASLNEGIEKGKGKYIARMDADDISFPTRLEEQYAFMEKNTDIVVCGTWAKKFGSDNGEYYKSIDDKSIRENFVINSTFIHPSVIIRSSALQKGNIKYDANYLHAEDYKFWLELLKVGKCANIPKVLLKYRISKEQISNKYRDTQVKTSQKIRREFIEQYFKELKCDFILPNTITLETIKKIKQSTYRNDKIIDAIIYTMYLSLNKYDYKSFIYFLFSFDYLKFPYNTKEFIRIMIKHMNPNRFYKWL